MEELFKILGSSSLYELNIVLDEFSKMNECYTNVDLKILKEGGNKVYGWRVHVFEKYFIEAERHTVWESAQGLLVDVTPFINYKSSLFIEDESDWTYKGVQEDNIRVNLRGNTLVDYIFEIKTAIFHILNKGERKFNNGLVQLCNTEAIDYQNLKIYESNYLRFLSEGNEENSLCYCNSSMVFSDCHKVKGKDLFCKVINES